MDRLYSRYPGGTVGIALLSLRLIIGAWIARDGVFLYLMGAQSEESAVTILVGTILVGIAFLLILGVRTSFAGNVGAALLLIGGLYSRALPSSIGGSDGWFYTLSLAFLTASLVLLGPGGYSLDARLSGWRSITLASGIPGGKRPPRGSGL
jgi:uncharacterized membrane protein YphA (DoxX/SURF4 family)